MSFKTCFPLMKMTNNNHWIYICHMVYGCFFFRLLNVQRNCNLFYVNIQFAAAPNRDIDSKTWCQHQNRSTHFLLHEIFDLLCANLIRKNSSVCWDGIWSFGFRGGYKIWHSQQFALRVFLIRSNVVIFLELMQHNYKMPIIILCSNLNGFMRC